MSGGSKDSTVTQTTQFPEEFRPYAQQMLGQGMQTAQQPYQAYTGQLVQPQSQYTQQAQDLTAQRALQGSPTDQAAGQQAAATLRGDYLGYSPGQNQYMGMRTPLGFNPYIGQQANVGANQYAGQNPYLEQSIQGTLGDMSRNYAVGTAAQTDAAASRMRALGGSAYNELSSMQGADLAKQMGQVSSGMRMQDYGMQQQLAESDINRRLGAYQTDVSRNAGLLESDLARRSGLAQTDIARNATLQESQLGRGQQLYTTERENQMRALGLAPSVQQMDYTNLGQLQAAGQAQDVYGQQQLDAQYQQWLNQQQYPYQQSQFASGLLGQLAGSQSQSTSPYSGTSPVTGALGGAVAGYGAGTMLGGATAGSTMGPWGALVGAGLGYLASR